MRIAQLAPLWKTVPPKKYGGSELIVSLLTESLVELGHEVTLYACRGSETKAKLVEIIDRPLYDILGCFKFDAIQFQDFSAIKRVFDDANGGKIDIIHNHMGFHPAALSNISPVPMVTTNHSSVAPDSEELARAAKDGNFVSISNAQRKLAPYLNYIGTVYHGINVTKDRFFPKGGDYLFYLATMWKEKGVDRAIKIAKATGMKMIMAGDIRRQEDFDEIKPYIDGKQITFIGEINEKQKIKLMGEARAYLFPIRWNEAFGLTVIEALAAGTPTIAYPNGSLPELIEDGKTGFLVKSIKEAAEAVKKIDKINREDCYNDARERFDASVMAKNYLKIYQKLIK